MKIKQLSETTAGAVASVAMPLGSTHKRTEEAANPAQQAAIAVNMKKAGKKPKNVKESLRDGEYVTFEVFFDDGTSEVLNFSGDDIDWDRVGAKRNKKVVNVKRQGGIRGEPQDTPKRPHEYPDDSFARAQRRYDRQLPESENSGNIMRGMLEAHISEEELLLAPGQGVKFKTDLLPKRTDHEVEMARNQLRVAAKSAKNIYQNIEDLSEIQGLDGWVQAKITKASDYLDAVNNYLDGKKQMIEIQDEVDEQVAGDHLDQAVSAQYNTPQAKAQSQAIDQAFASGDEQEFQRLGIQSPQQIERDYQTMLAAEPAQDAALMRNPKLTPSARPVQRYNPKGVPIREMDVEETKRLSTREKFKRSLKRAGYDPDAGANRLLSLIAKQAEERKERENQVFYNNEAIGHIKTDEDGDLVGIVYDRNNRPYEIYGYDNVDDLKKEIFSVYNQRVKTGVKEAYNTGEDNREYFDNVQEWAKAVKDFGGDVIKARGVYVAHGWEGEAGEFDPATGEGWLVDKVIKEGLFGISDKIKGKIQYITNELSDIPGYWDHKNQTFTEKGLESLQRALKRPEFIKYALSLTADDYDADLEEDWQKTNRRDKTSGMSRKAVKQYRRENPGSKLQTAVTTKPSKLKKGSKSAKRRKSFCSRMRGMKKSRTSAKTARDPNSNINKALRRWNCESVEELRNLALLAEQKIAMIKEDQGLEENLHKWFKEKWVRFGPDGKIRGDCARGDDSEGKPKCLPQSKAHSLGKKGRASAAARKRREDPNPERSGKAINVATKKKSNEDSNQPNPDAKKNLKSAEEIIRALRPDLPPDYEIKVNKDSSKSPVGGKEQLRKDIKDAGKEVYQNDFYKESSEHEMCPECGGAMYGEEMINEKKDACYYKVKSRYKVWPSAYASGALVKCRKSGAKNWGNKSK